MELININNINNIEISNVKRRGRPPNLNKIIKVKKSIGRPKSEPLTDDQKLQKLYNLREYWQRMKANRKQRRIEEGTDEIFLKAKRERDLLKLRTIKALQN